jgi:LuxR family transcriptional regulator, maltose regulon positive regulatory protein
MTASAERDRPAGDPPGEGGVPLAEAKLSAPRTRSGMIERRRLNRTLDAAGGAALTLVAAPPGYGKTTAVRAWCAASNTAFAWVTLDEGDNDPNRLWRYVATAVDRVRQGLGARALRRLDDPASGLANPIDELMNGIAGYDRELVLVLDDMQHVTDPECLELIGYSLERLPAAARMIIVTRIDPALKIPQLRARGDLVELRADQLAFTAEEAHELLVERVGLELASSDVELLRERTEGWPAALFLAGYWLRGVDNPHEAAAEFDGNHRFVADYLGREVIASLDEDTRSFLLRVSVMGRFTAELCDGVLDRSDSSRVLAELEQANLFLTRLEHGGWLRMHSIFAEFARFQLDALEPQAARQIHRRAARWLAARGFPVEATEHAAAAQDHELVSGLLLSNHLRMIRTGSSRTMLRWLGTLPNEQLLEYPELAVGGAVAALLVGQATLLRRRLLAVAARARSERPELYTPYVACVADMVAAAAMDNGVRQAVLSGHRSVAIAESDADEVLVAALAARARALYLAGELDEAWDSAMRAIEHPDAQNRPPGHAAARTTLALIAAERGWVAAARTHTEEAKAIIGGVASSRSWLGAMEAAALGTVLAGEGSLPEAEREFATAERLFRDEVPTVDHTWALIMLAEVRCRRGRIEAAQAALGGAYETITALTNAGRLPSWAADVERGLELVKGQAASGELLELPSEAELAVLRQLGSDRSAREIGHDLFLSANTVHSHMRSIYRKLGVHSRADAVARADALQLFGPSESPM